MPCRDNCRLLDLLWRMGMVFMGVDVIGQIWDEKYDEYVFKMVRSFQLHPSVLRHPVTHPVTGHPGTLSSMLTGLC